VRIMGALYHSAKIGNPVKLPVITKRKRPRSEQTITRPAIQTPRLVNAQPPRGPAVIDRVNSANTKQGKEPGDRLTLAMIEVAEPTEAPDSGKPNAHPHRNFRLALRTLAGALLPGGSLGDQPQLLPSAQRRRAAGLVCADASSLLLRREGEPLHHSPQAATGSG
jgi:hypothetical protein